LSGPLLFEPVHSFSQMPKNKKGVEELSANEALLAQMAKMTKAMLSMQQNMNTMGPGPGTKAPSRQQSLDTKAGAHAHGEARAEGQHL
jgi:hypothetical protein